MIFPPLWNWLGSSLCKTYQLFSYGKKSNKVMCSHLLKQICVKTNVFLFDTMILFYFLTNGLS